MMMVVEKGGRPPMGRRGGRLRRRQRVTTATPAPHNRRGGQRPTQRVVMVVTPSTEPYTNAGAGEGGAAQVEGGHVEERGLEDGEGEVVLLWGGMFGFGLGVVVRIRLTVLGLGNHRLSVVSEMCSKGGLNHRKPDPVD